MTDENWIDITQEILKLPKSFKLLQTVRDEKFVLEDGMHAHEINDNKIDPKYNISEEDTIEYLLKNNKITLPSQLSFQQLLGILIKTCKLQSLVLKGYPLHNTIYKFAYLYDQSIYVKQKESNLITQAIYTLVNSINSLGSYFYELHKESSSIKEDDLSITLYSFSTLYDSHEQIIKEFATLETALLNKAKQDKENSLVYNQLVALIKVRRLTHSLVKSMGRYFDNKLSAKIQKDIQSLSSAVASVQEQFKFENGEIDSEKALQGSGIYSESIYKILRTHFGPRQIPKISLKQWIEHMKTALQQFSLFIPVPTRVSLLKQRIQRLVSMPLNIWSKSYIKNNMFHKEEYIFCAYRTEDLILNDMNEYVPIKENWKSDEKFVALIKPTGPVVSEVLFRYLGKPSRSFWEASKIYEDLNILIHLSNEFDSYISLPNKKQLYVSSWYYNFGLNVMIKQLFSGIQIELYQHYQYPYVFYMLENLLAVYDRNSQVFMKKFDKTYYQSFVEDSLNNKKKKKISEANRKYFTDTVFKKALHYYVRSIHRLLFVMVSRKLLQNPFSQHLETRIKNRFRIFKNVYFVRTIDYQQYTRDYEVICQDQNGYLTEAMELLKEAKNLFQKITQLDDSDCFYKQRQDAESLVKICVKCSLAVMSLKMGQNNKSFKIQNKHPRYPQISMS